LGHVKKEAKNQPLGSVLGGDRSTFGGDRRQAQFHGELRTHSKKANSGYANGGRNMHLIEKSGQQPFL